MIGIKYFSRIAVIFILFLKCACSTETLNLCTTISMTGEVLIPDYLMKNGMSQSFKTRVLDVNCSEAEVVHKFANNSESTPPFQFLTSGDIEDPIDGYFLRDEYCISKLNEDLVEIKHCNVICGVTHTCVKKCCPPNEIVDFSGDPSHSLCRPSNVSWTPTFYDTHKGCGAKSDSSNQKIHLLVLSDSSVKSEYQPYKNIKVNRFYHEDIVCNSSREYGGLRFRLMKQGHLMSQDVFGHWLEIQKEEFCIDGMTGYIGSDSYQGNLNDQVFLDIGPSNDANDSNFNETDYFFEGDEEQDTNSWEVKVKKTYISLMLIGAVFLFATSVLYLLIWEKHNIHGWTIFAFVTTMFFMFVFLAASHITLMLGNTEASGSGACRTLGILAHFFYLSTMCWLTVINIDLWLTFRNVKPSRKAQTALRFFLYALFAYGIPMLIVGLGVTADFWERSYGSGSECESPIILPLYGEHQCYLQERAYWPYLYIPMTILSTCNILTFSSTVFTLCVYRKHTRQAVQSASRQKESVILFGKLYVVTGISWVLEIISNTFSEPWWLWVIFDAYNLLQAVLIFAIFALKRENVLYLYHKYPWARFLLLPVMRTPCCYTDSFDPERTEMTGLPTGYRNSRISFRRGSNLSTSAIVSTSSNGSAWRRRNSEDF